jgi:hypothetical protein
VNELEFPILGWLLEGVAAAAASPPPVEAVITGSEEYA